MAGSSQGAMLTFQSASEGDRGMEALQAIIPILITVSLAGLVLAVGLNCSREDLLYVLTRPKKLYRAIMAVLIIPPLLAGLLIAFVPLAPVIKAGIMLMAVSPVP